AQQSCFCASATSTITLIETMYAYARRLGSPTVAGRALRRGTGLRIHALNDVLGSRAPALAQGRVYADGGDDRARVLRALWSRELPVVLGHRAHRHRGRAVDREPYVGQHDGGRGAPARAALERQLFLPAARPHACLTAGRLHVRPRDPA